MPASPAAPRTGRSRSRGKPLAGPAPDPAPPEGAASGLPAEVVRLREEVERLTGLYRELVGRLGTFTRMEESYLRLVALYARYGVVSPDVLVPSATDPMSKEVLRALALISEGSVQEITERVRELRGRASRRIVRERLERLQRAGAVELRATRGGRALWRLSEEVVRKWAEVLGLSK